MTCDCQKEITQVKDAILKQTNERFKENTACHADMKQTVNDLDKKVDVKFAELDATLKPFGKIIWIIVGSFLATLVAAFSALILK